MCCSLDNATFSGTRIYLGEADHPTAGFVTVLGYENTVQNRALGPNAMILHFPAAQEMTAANVVDTSGSPSFLRDMEDAVRPRMRGRSLGMEKDAVRSVHVFEHGIYTIVMSGDPLLIADALEQVPERKRPPLHAELFASYAERQPGFSMAVCCFDTRDATEATPMLWWYVPMGGPMRMAPALDSHDGTIPNLSGKVEVDHWLFLGSTRRNVGMRVRYSEDQSPLLDALLPSSVVGFHFEGRMPNGDFLVPAGMLATGRGEITRGLLSV